MKGALAFYDSMELIIHDMPTFERNKTNRLDCHLLSKIIKAERPDFAFVEQVNAFGMGVTSAYNFGFGCGAIEAILSCHEVPFTYVTPQKWKKEMSCPADKDSSRMRATQLMPAHAHNWSLKKHDGRAEASLIALYGWKHG